MQEEEDVRVMKASKQADTERIRMEQEKLDFTRMQFAEDCKKR